MLSVVWGLLLCGAPCGCGLTSRTVPLLLSGVSLAALMCLFLWSLGTGALLFGGHGQCLLCQPFYNRPRYEVFGLLLDSGGVLYEDGGVFREFLPANASDDVRVQDVLKLVF